MLLLSTIDCLSHKLQIASSFLFLDGIEPFFGRHFSMCPFTKRSSIFDLGPLNLLPKIACFHKIAYKLACMADRPEMFAPTKGFSEMADSVEPCKMLCHGNEIWARRGDAVA